MIYLEVEKNPESLLSEAYRTMRTSVLHSSSSMDLKTLLITSPGSQEGKTTIAANLAVAMSQIGKKVLVMDCDLRRPSIHRVFDITNVLGLSRVLIDNLMFEHFVIKHSSNLHILTCGDVPQNPAEILASHAFENLLEHARQLYDIIILDSPPIIAVTDAQILSNMVDGVLLVVNSSVSPIEACEKAKNLLKSINANIIGVVLNKAENRRGKYYSYSNYIKKTKHTTK